MNPTQEKIIKQCYDLLSEHFDCVVILTLEQDEGGSGQDDLRTSHYGGFHQALGMMEQAIYSYKSGDISGHGDQG